VGITIAIKSSKHKDRRLFFHRIDKTMRKEAKYVWIAEREAIGGVAWDRLVPDQRNTWLVPENADEFAALPPLGSKEGKAADGSQARVIFKDYSLGVATHRDNVVYDFDRRALTNRIQ